MAYPSYITPEMAANLDAFANWAAEQNDDSGGRTLADVSDQLLNQPGVASTFEVLGLDTAPPPGLSPEQTRQWEAAVSSLGNLQFEVGYRNSGGIAEAVSDALEYQVKGLEALRNDFQTLADPNANADAKTNAALRVKKLGTQFVGDIEDTDSGLNGYRRAGDSYFTGTKAIEGFTPDERAAAAFDVSGQQTVDPDEFTVGDELQRIAAARRGEALGGQPTRGGIPAVSKTRPTRATAGFGGKEGMTADEYAAAIQDASGDRGGMSPAQYEAALRDAAAGRAGGGAINYAPLPQARAGQIADLPTRGAINYNDNAPTATAARIGAVPDVGSFSYTNPIVQAQAAQTQRTPDIDPRSINYGPIPYAMTSQISPEAMVDDRAIQMVQSKYEDPSYYGDLDPRGLEGMGESLDYLDELIANEGRDAVSEAYYNAKRRESEATRRGHLQAAVQDLEARGMGTSGGELQAAIQGANATTRDLYDASMQAAALAQQRKDSANADRAVQAEAHRRVTFGEAATIEEALRDVSKARAKLEMERQVTNSETLRAQADLEQETRLANLEVKANELNARGRFAEEAAVRNQITALETNIHNATLRNNTNIANMESANLEYRGRNRAMEEGVLQTQDLKSQRNTEQARLQNIINERNAIIAGEDWNARNRALEDISESDFQAGADRNSAQAELDTNTNIANAGFQANEVGYQNRFQEDELQSYYDMLANAAIGDASTRAAIAGQNAGYMGDAYSGYASGGQFSDQYALEMQRLKMERENQPPGALRTAAAVGGIVGGVGNTAYNAKRTFG